MRLFAALPHIFAIVYTRRLLPRSSRGASSDDPLFLPPVVLKPIQLEFTCIPE